MSAREARNLNPSDAWTDLRLVRACLDGSEDAWNAILDKYKRLIYSIPIKHGFSPEDASDIFQSVCVELLKELPRLREPRALAGWLIKVTAHKCFGCNSHTDTDHCQLRIGTTLSRVVTSAL